MKTNTAWSHLAQKEVSTWSEEWKHECEVRTILRMSPTERKQFFNGIPGDNSMKGVIALRGKEVADRLHNDMYELKERLDEAKNKPSSVRTGDLFSGL